MAIPDLRRAHYTATAAPLVTALAIIYPPALPPVAVPPPVCLLLADGGRGYCEGIGDWGLGIGWDLMGPIWGRAGAGF